jgi:hypothetical protein
LGYHREPLIRCASSPTQSQISVLLRNIVGPRYSAIAFVKTLYSLGLRNLALAIISGAANTKMRWRGNDHKHSGALLTALGPVR